MNESERDSYETLIKHHKAHHERDAIRDAELDRLRGIIAEVRALALAGHEPGAEAEHTWRMLIANALAEVDDGGNTQAVQG